MASADAEVIHRHFKNANRRRFEELMTDYDPAVELFVSPGVAVDAGVYRGVEAVGEWFGSWFRTFAHGYRLEIVELHELDEGIAVTVDHYGAGRASGAEVTQRVYNTYRLREGRIVRVELFRERDEALEALRRPG